MAAILTVTIQAFSKGGGAICLTDAATNQSYNFASVADADAQFKFSSMNDFRDALMHIIWQCGRAQNVTLPAQCVVSVDPTISTPITLTFSSLPAAQEIG